MTAVGEGTPVALGLALGWAADAVIGDPARHHPVATFGRAAQRLETTMWEPSRVAGVAFVLTLVVPVAVAMAVAEAALRRDRRAHLVLMGIVMWTVLGGRSLGHEARRLGDAVERGDLAEARRIAPALMGRDPCQLDESELCRGAVESVAENTADAVVGPLLWAALAGPAGAVAYRAANTLDAMVGHRDDRYERFGWAAARLDDLLTWPAARLSAALSVLLAPLVCGDSRRGWQTLRRYGARHPSPNAGRLEAAFAGVFGVQLGGTNRYGDRVENRPIIGEGPRAGVDTVRRSVRLSRLVGAAVLPLCALIALRNGR